VSLGMAVGLGWVTFAALLGLLGWTLFRARR
jgi:hypothetical protein